MKLIHSTAAWFPTVHLTDFCAEIREFHLLYKHWKDFTNYSQYATHALNGAA